MVGSRTRTSPWAHSILLLCCLVQRKVCVPGGSERPRPDPWVSTTDWEGSLSAAEACVVGSLIPPQPSDMAEDKPTPGES